MRQNFYLHFETKPSFAELDTLFDFCEKYEPVMSNSYILVFDTTGQKACFFDIVHQCFPRYRYVVLQFASKNIRQNREAPYVPTGL